MPKRNFLHKKEFFCIKGLPNVTFYVCKRSFSCSYQYHTLRENQLTADIVLKKVHAQKIFHAQKKIFFIKKRFFCIKGLPNVTFYVCKMSFNCRYQYHTRRENQSTTGIVLKKVRTQKKIFCIKRDFSAQKGCPMLLSMRAKCHSIIGTNITCERKTSQLWALF